MRGGTKRTVTEADVERLRIAARLTRTVYQILQEAGATPLSNQIGRAVVAIDKALKRAENLNWVGFIQGRNTRQLNSRPNRKEKKP